MLATCLPSNDRDDLIGNRSEGFAAVPDAPTVYSVVAMGKGPNPVPSGIRWKSWPGKPERGADGLVGRAMQIFRDDFADWRDPVPVELALEDPLPTMGRASGHRDCRSGTEPPDQTEFHSGRSSRLVPPVNHGSDPALLMGRASRHCLG